MELNGTRVVVTGASRGIGAMLATKLADKGARVALVARSRDAIGELAAQLGGDAYPADLADVSTIEPLVRAIETDGPIDVLVNNAGVDLAGSFVDLEPERIRELIGVNLVAPMLLCRAVIPTMRRRGGGHIMNVSSLAGTNALPGLVPYSTSKAGLSHFTAALRAECKGMGITTTLVEIGPVETSMMESLHRHPATERALARLRTLHLSVELDLGHVVEVLVTALEHECRHVRLPRRNALFPLLTEAPRRMTELLLTGVRAQDHSGRDR
ncbi:MAG TPA: SDR family NAD(P)-dependent oxidoreductase [Acidimicrobiia bacterium]|nr:SDR family NAD(P)-dependent oxidoreductase [Acidimicrobiia bacterium]